MNPFPALVWSGGVLDRLGGACQILVFAVGAMDFRVLLNNGG